MHIDTVKLRNFRSFEDSQITLQRDLSVFVGENNGGKSNAIDAIRLLTLPLGGRREIYCEATDVRFQSNSSTFELEGHIADLSMGQRGRLLSAVTDVTMERAMFGLRFDGGKPGARPLIWAGREGNSPEPGCMDIRCFDDGQKVYIEMPALSAGTDLPPLFLLGTDNKAELVNYRIQNRYLIIDRLLDRAELRLGDKGHQKIVRIRRVGGKSS